MQLFQFSRFFQRGEFAVFFRLVGISNDGIHCWYGSTRQTVSNRFPSLFR